jgi:hypothetical protein
MAEKRQLDRPENEKSLIRAMFNDNETLQRGLRQFFFQLPMSNDEETAVKGLSADQIEILRKEMLPSIADNRPVGMSNDVWSGLSASDGVDATYPRILVRELMVNYFEQQFMGLKTGAEVQNIVLASLVKRPFDGERLHHYVNICAYLTIMATVELHLNSLWMVGNQEIKTPDEVMASLKKDSSE